VAVALALLAAAARGAEPGVVAFDFESGDLQGWRVVEGRFDRLVADIEFFHNEPQVRYNKQGRYFLNTIELGNGSRTDEMTGVLESPVFVLKGGRATLLVGGGSHADTYVALCTEDGKEVRRASGKDTERFQRVAWDVAALAGQKVFLRIVDRNRGGWGHVLFDDFRAEGEVDARATAARFAALDREALAAARRAVTDAARSLRAAIDDLRATFGPRYPRGEAFLARLGDLERRAAAAPPDGTEALRGDLEALSREALLANPMLAAQPILFVVRRQYRPDHHNTETMFQTGEINTGSFTGGGALKTIDFGRGGEVRTLLEVPQGVARDPDVRFDGRRVLFSMRRDIRDDYHLYEIGADGAGVRQRTFLGGVTDIDPLYLPDGRIAFTSTREPKYCMCNRHIMGNLFRADADGANIQQIGHSTLHEGHGALAADGTILYDRWEYVDRNFGDAQGLWTCNPDGTNHAVRFGNNTASPGGIIDARPIAGTSRFVATFTSCHDRPWGALALVDRGLGVDGKPPVLRTWPASAIDLVMVGDYDTFTRVAPKYEDPYPLDDPSAPGAAGKYFLCSRQVRGEEMGLALVDVFGNEVLLHSEPPGCYDPMPLGPRPRPPVVPDRIDLAKTVGYFYIHDVYVGTGMERVPRGTVKRVRVVESPEKRSWTGSAWDGGTGQQAPGMAWNDFNNKRILGTAPVEADGSAYLAVPADRFVYFELLDEQGMMVQSMRSGTIARPGETAGCAGCHEDRQGAVAGAARTAFRRPPSALEPWYGEPRLFSYRAEVQPVFDRHCLKCHDFGGRGAKKVVLAGDLTRAFNVSYMELRRKGLVKVVGAGPTEVQMPRSWGSHASRLVEVLRKGHNDVRLSAEDFDRLVTWIDINAPYYPSYASAYPGNLYGRSPLDNDQLAALGKLTGMDLGGRHQDFLVSFTRPAMSPCLAGLREKDEAKYRDALALIEAGRQALARRPREDMPGAPLDGLDAAREAKYAHLARLEAEARAAALAGRKVYDPRTAAEAEAGAKDK